MLDHESFDVLRLLSVLSSSTGGLIQCRVSYIVKIEAKNSPPKGRYGTQEFLLGTGTGDFDDVFIGIAN